MILFCSAASRHWAQIWGLLLQWPWLVLYILFVWLTVCGALKTSEGAVAFMVVRASGEFTYDFFLNAYYHYYLLYKQPDSMLKINQSSFTILLIFFFHFSSSLLKLGHVQKHFLHSFNRRIDKVLYFPLKIVF